MDNVQRRKQIIEILHEAEAPVNGTTLAKMCKVSRQIIVGDIAMLRAKGSNIISTPRGYQLLHVEPVGYRRLMVCKHGMELMQLELETMVDNGGVVENVLVEHEVYGELEAKLNLRSRRDLQQYMTLMKQSHAPLLSSLSGGIHTHSIWAMSEEELDVIEEKLDALGILYKG